MASQETVTLRAKRTPKESSRDMRLSATKAWSRKQREEDQGGHCPLQGLDLWESDLCPPLTPRTRRRTRLEKLCLEGDCHMPASSPCRLGTKEPASPSLQPCCKGTYFLGLPVDECQEPAVPSLLVPVAPARSRDVPRKTRSIPEHTLVLELDGTLVYSSLHTSCRRGAVATFNTVFQGDSYEVYLKLRPYVQQFLESVSKTYEIFTFTTAKQDYAEKLLDVLDPKKKLIRHCLSQQDCVCVQGCYWKDLSHLDRDLAKTVVLDYTIQGFPAQAANWILVPRWSGDPRDKELLELTPLLGQLSQVDDVRIEIQRLFPHRRLPAED